MGTGTLTSMRGIRRAGVVVAVGTLLSTAAASGAAGGESRTLGTAASASASASQVAQARRAVRTAERAVRGGRAYDVESDRLRGRRVWEVKVAQGTARPYELDVSADGRQVLRRQRLTRIDDDVRKVARAQVALASALTIAGRRARGSFDEADIDRSRGRLVWEATFVRSGDREVEVAVDARNGRVLSVTTDD
jgi:uncharacterized membrane protein YkoI